MKLRMAMNAKIIAILLTSAVLTSCVSTRGALDNGTSALLASGPLSGDLGIGLDASSKRSAIQTELKALSSGQAGVPVEWVGKDGTKGRVTPGQPFEVAGRVCRQYSHAIVSGGTEKSARATACENEKKVWEPLQ